MNVTIYKLILYIYATIYEYSTYKYVYVCIYIVPCYSIEMCLHLNLYEAKSSHPLNYTLIPYKQLIEHFVTQVSSVHHKIVL